IAGAPRVQGAHPLRGDAATDFGALRRSWHGRPQRGQGADLRARSPREQRPPGLDARHRPGAGHLPADHARLRWDHRAHPPARSARVHLDVPSGQGGAVTMILFLDDNVAFLRDYRDELRSRGHDALVTASTDDALRAVEQHGDELDAMVLDMMMPPGKLFEKE